MLRLGSVILTAGNSRDFSNTSGGRRYPFGRAADRFEKVWERTTHLLLFDGNDGTIILAE